AAVAIGELDQHEHDPGNDQKVDQHGQKRAIGKYRALLLGIGKITRCDGGGQRNKIVVEVQPPEHRADDRHNQVADDRIDDLAKGNADDESDGQVKRVALE